MQEEADREREKTEEFDKETRVRFPKEKEQEPKSPESTMIDTSFDFEEQEMAADEDMPPVEFLKQGITSFFVTKEE